MGWGVAWEVFKGWVKEHLVDFVYLLLVGFWGYMSFHYWSVLMKYVQLRLWFALWTIYKEVEWWLIISLIMLTYVLLKWDERRRMNNG